MSAKTMTTVVIKSYRIIIKSALAMLAVLYLAHRFTRQDMEDLSYLDAEPGVNAGDLRKRVNSPLRYIRLYDLHQPLTDQINETIHQCVHSATEKPFWICVYHESEDKFISSALMADGIWEPYLTNVLTKTLDLFPEATLIDIGANIGYFSLLAAAKGHKVIAVEPYWTNVHHLHAGSQESGLHGQMTLVRNVMSHKHEHVTLADNDDNKGGITVLLPGQPAHKASIDPENHHVPTVILDDLLQLVATGTAVIKIDVEGYECRAFARARRFLTRMHVPYIFMEWQKMFSQKWKYYTACPTDTIRKLTAFLVELGYIPYDIKSYLRLSPEGSTVEWKLGDVFWRHETAGMVSGPS